MRDARGATNLSKTNFSKGQRCMASNDYYEQIDETFEAVETALEGLPDDVDIRCAEGVINATFSNGVVFVFSRQPPTEQLWLATPGGGFHYVWDDQSGAWRDTKTDESFHEFLVSELKTHTGLQLRWDGDEGAGD
jgi:CyaY protein